MALFLPFLLVFSLIFLANLAEAGASERFRKTVSAMLLLFNLPPFVLGLILLLLPTAQLDAVELGLELSNYRSAGLSFLFMAIWGLLATLPEIRRILSNFIPIKPASAVHTLALILAGYLLGNSMLSLTQGGLEGLVETSSAASLVEVLASGLLYVALAVTGVGITVRRSSLKLLERLGLEPLNGRQLRYGLRWVGLLLLLQWATGLLLFFTNPEQAELLDELTSLLLSEMDTIGEWFLLALSASIGEEILFRGALQPVFGLWLTSFIFAMAHVQYGFTPATLLIFVLAAVLGIVRRRTNTTVAIFVHFTYNFLLGLLSLLATQLAI